MAQYWIVGATVQGEDLTDAFVEHGFWYADAEGAQENIPNIQVGGRLAIKRMLGQGATEVGIRAIGEAEATRDYKYGKESFTLIYVKWFRLAQERRVPFQGWGSALHGPYSETDQRIAGVFSL